MLPGETESEMGPLGWKNVFFFLLGNEQRKGHTIGRRNIVLLVELLSDFIVTLL